MYSFIIKIIYFVEYANQSNVFYFTFFFVFRRLARRDLMLNYIFCVHLLLYSGTYKVLMSI